MKFVPPRSEPEVIAEMVELNVGFVSSMKCPYHRSEHGKGVADVKAEFTVVDHIRDDLQQGLFAKIASYDATVRFSNGAVQDDDKRDTHGMAIKVHKVPMETAPVDQNGERFQDFILLDCPTFPIGELEPYLPFSRAFLASKIDLNGKLKLLVQLIKNPRMAYFVLRMALNRPNAPLSPSYFSTTPYQLGSHAVKYIARPVGRVGDAPRIKGENGRREALRQQLKRGPGLFTFGVLVQTDPVRQPIDDPTIDWEERGAEFFPLAEIRIPSDQVISAPEEVENELTYSPGHAAAEHFPLGALNRARVAIYSAARKARQKEFDSRG